VFDGLRKGTTQPTVAIPTFTANGTADLRDMRAPEFVVGGIHYHDLICGEIKDDGCTIGLEFLERHLATMDFPGQRLYLKPSHEFERRSQADMCGIGAERKGGQLVVAGVIAGSPAQQAGIREGDILLSINGKPVGEYGMGELREIFDAAEGRELTITFSRGGQQQTVSFKLRPAI
jgi:C-terminal processing protease CtpA/Prc